MAKQAKTLSVLEVIQTVNDGGALEDMKDAIRRVSTTVEERGGQGSVSLTLKFSKLGRHQLKIVDEVKVTEPKKVNDATVFFSTNEGDLTRSNPEQLELGIGVDVE